MKRKRLKNKNENRNKNTNFKFTPEGRGGQNIRCIKKQEWGFPVGQPILIYVLGGWSRSRCDFLNHDYLHIYFTFTPNTSVHYLSCCYPRCSS